MEFSLLTIIWDREGAYFIGFGCMTFGDGPTFSGFHFGLDLAEHVWSVDILWLSSLLP